MRDQFARTKERWRLIKSSRHFVRWDYLYGRLASTTIKMNFQANLILKPIISFFCPLSVFTNQLQSTPTIVHCYKWYPQRSSGTTVPTQAVSDNLVANPYPWTAMKPPQQQSRVTSRRLWSSSNCDSRMHRCYMYVLSPRRLATLPVPRENVFKLRTLRVIFRDTATVRCQEPAYIISTAQMTSPLQNDDLN